MNVGSSNNAPQRDSSLPDGLVVLMRARPGSRQAGEAESMVASLAAREAVSTLVFFHGPGVMSAASPDSVAIWAQIASRGHVSLCVCEASWQRRCGAPPPAGFEVSSLVQFWHRALGAKTVLSIGADVER